MKIEAQNAYRSCAAYTLNAIDRAVETIAKVPPKDAVMRDVLSRRAVELKKFREQIVADLENNTQL